MVSFLIISSVFYYYKVTHKRVNSISVIAVFPFIVERLFIRIMKTTDFILPRFNRFLMFYIICKKYDLHLLLQTMMPKFAYKVLVGIVELQEQRLSGNENMQIV